MKYLQALLLFAILCLTASTGLAQSVTTTSTISTYAGGTRGAYGDGGPAATAQLLVPQGMAFDSAGNLYVADMGHYLVRKITPAGVISTVAGNGEEGYSGDGGAATSATFGAPVGVAVDTNGNLYISDRAHHVIRKVTSAGIISTFAGTGTAGFSGDGGPASSATLNGSGPFNLALDSGGNLYVADVINRRVRKITPAGVISTVAGTGTAGTTGNGGLATAATFQAPGGIAFDSVGQMHVVDSGSNNIRRISTGGTISAFAGAGGAATFSGDGGQATSARFAGPSGITFDSSGSLYVCDNTSSRVRKITTAGVISTVLGTGTMPSGGDGGQATLAQIGRCNGLAFDSGGNLYISDQANNNIRKVTLAGVVSTIAWGYGGDGGAATSAILQTPAGMALDSSGTLYFAEQENHRVRRITAAGVISTFAGTGTGGNSGDGGQATSAMLAEPSTVALDLSGNLLITDQSAHVIRRVTPAGVISTIAGTGNSPGFSGDGGPATSAQLNGPLFVTVDAAGNIYISEPEGYRIRKITPAGTISTFAGTGSSGSTGDGGAATSAQLLPFGLAVDSSGSLYVSDPLNNNIRKITSSGTISTILGTGSSNSSIQLNEPLGLAMDSAGNLFIGDRGNRRVLKRTASGTVTTVAGSGTRGSGGDGGSAASAQFDYPAGIAVSASGDLYIADIGNHNIRKITFTQQGSFAITDRGGTSVSSTGAGSNVVAGYGTIAPAAGSTTPSGLAIFGYRQNGVLVSEAGVPASTVLQFGRIFAEVNGPVNTGLAIANPNGTDATISFYFTDANGNNFGAGSTTISAYNQMARFLDQAPFSGGSSVSGTFSFTSSIPVAVIALRGFTNERGEFLITTLPLADLSATVSTSAYVFPHFAEGGGWTTQIVLVNAGDSALTGSVQFRDAQGAVNPVNVAGTTSDAFSYSIPARSSLRLQTAGTATETLSGFVRVVPSGGTAAPSGLAIFSYRLNGVTVAEAGVPAAAAGSAFRFYAETLGNFGSVGSIQTGLAVANLSTSATTVTVELTRLDGTSTGLTGTLSVPASGKAATFLNQITGLETLQSPFQGVMRVSSSASITVTGLRGRYNERGDFLITTTPPVDESAATTTSSRFFPQIADSGGYTTQFIMFSGQSGQSSSATMSLRSSTGGAMDVGTQ